MKYESIRSYERINNTDDTKVNELVKSMLENGWQGCPILVYGESLLTGCHRMAALDKIYQMYMDDEIEEAEVLNQDIAEDVTEIVEENIAKTEEEQGWAPDIDYSNIGWLLKGSWVEEYKSEMIEW